MPTGVKWGVARTCAFGSCDRELKTNGLCSGHNAQRLRGRPLKPLRTPRSPACTFPGCTRAHESSGLCSGHNAQRRRGTPLRPIRDRSGGCINSSGYRMIYRPEAPGAGSNGQIAEHRFVMQELLGRPLQPEETVHHKNGVRHDNRPENLELWSKSHPSGQRVVDKIAWARELLALYDGVSLP